jgi:hypothetical protein
MQQVGSFRGLATVIDHKGEEHEVKADLTSRTDRIPVGDQVLDGLIEWWGSLSGHAPWFDMQGEMCILRIGTREGEFTVAHLTTLDDAGPVAISGSGPVPF